MGDIIGCLGAEEKVEGGWDSGGGKVKHTKCLRFCLNQTALYHKVVKVQPLHALFWALRKNKRVKLEVDGKFPSTFT